MPFHKQELDMSHMPYLYTASSTSAPLHWSYGETALWLHSNALLEINTEGMRFVPHARRTPPAPNGTTCLSAPDALCVLHKGSYVFASKQPPVVSSLPLSDPLLHALQVL